MDDQNIEPKRSILIIRWFQWFNGGCVLSYFFLKTNDGSYSLSHDCNSELMHSQDGAYQETQYVYGKAIDWIFDRVSEPSFLVVGLGLGYIEYAILARAIQRNNLNIIIHSFEADQKLTKNFLNWILGDIDSLSDSFVKAYKTMENFYINQFNLTSYDFKKGFLFLLKNKRLLIDAELSMTTSLKSEYHGIFYDVYSASTNALLWEPSFLRQILLNASYSNAVFATYSSRGSLKKVLKESKFECFFRKGFSRKKESTFAVRENELT